MRVGELVNIMHPPPVLFVSADSKGLAGALFVSADSKGVRGVVRASADSKGVKSSSKLRVEKLNKEKRL
jgi:hypothetical protein